VYSIIRRLKYRELKDIKCIIYSKYKELNLFELIDKLNEKNGQGTWATHFAKEETWMANKHMTRSSWRKHKLKPPQWDIVHNHLNDEVKQDGLYQIDENV
jgi:hypothetical protein